MPGARLDYDNAAFYHFFIAVLFIFLAPFSYYVLQRVVSFLILRGKKYEMKAGADARGAGKIRKDRDGEKAVQLTVYQRIFVYFYSDGPWLVLVFRRKLGCGRQRSRLDPFKILDLEPGADARAIKRLTESKV